jgi:hypothetical protein
MLFQSGNTWNPPAVVSAGVTSNEIAFQFNPQMDVPYSIQASTNLAQWETIYTGVGNGQLTSYTETLLSGNAAKFYRMVLP